MEKKPIFPRTDATDRLFAVIYLAVGYGFIQMTVSLYGSGALGIFTVCYAAAVLLYLYRKKMCPPAESWFWLAVMMALGLPYDFWTVLGFVQVLALIAVAAYWTLCASGRLLEGGKTSQWIFFDVWNALAAVPFLNFTCQVRVLFAGLGKEVAETKEKKAEEGQAKEGQAIDGLTKKGQAKEKTKEGQAIEARTIDEQAIEGQTIKEQAKERPAKEGLAIEELTKEGQATEAQTIDGLTKEELTEEELTEEGLTEEELTEELTEEGQVLEDQTGKGNHPGSVLHEKTRKMARLCGILHRILPGILLGILIAVPLLIIVLPLLSDADAGFARLTGSLGLMIVDLTGNLGRMIGKLAGNVWRYLKQHFLSTFIKMIFAVPVSFYLFGLVFGGIHGRNTDTVRIDTLTKAGKDVRKLPDTASCTALAILCLVYALFIGLQGSYLFSAFAGTLPEEFTYAEYARRGFFELCRIGVWNLIFLGLAGLCSLMPSREHKGLRLLTVLLSVLTLLLLATAVSKLAMYISVYGLTVKRVVPMVFLVWLVLVFAAVIARQHRDFPMVRFCVMAGAVLFCLLCIFPVERLTELYNAWANACVQ